LLSGGAAGGFDGGSDGGGVGFNGGGGVPTAVKELCAELKLAGLLEE